jgi:hypothetical protein
MRRIILLAALLLTCAAHAKTLSWTMPTERVDGTPLLASELLGTLVLCDPGLETFVGMPDTSWELFDPAIESCVVRAIDQDGLESADSARVFPVWDTEPQPEAPGPPTDLRYSFVELPPATGPPGGGAVSDITVGAADTYFFSSTWSGSGWEIDINVDIEAADAVLIIVTQGAALTDVVKTLGGEELTRLGEAGLDRRSIWYFLADPPTGSQRLLFQHQSPARSHSLQVIHLNGVDKANPVRGAIQSASSFATGVSLDIAGSVAGDLVISAACTAGGTSTTLGSGQTSIINHRGQGSAEADRFYSVSSKEATGDPTPVSYSFGGSASSSEIYGFSFVPAAASGSTLEASLSTPAAALAANVGVQRTVSAALSVPPATLAGASEIERHAAADLSLAALQLNADAGVLRQVSAAFGVPISVLAGNAVVERNAEVSLLLPQAEASSNVGAEKQASVALESSSATLNADAGSVRTASATLESSEVALASSAGSEKQTSASLESSSATLSGATGAARIASASLEISAPDLLSDLIIERLASAVLNAPAATLAGDTGSQKTAAAALVAEPSSLASSLGAERQASATLEIPDAELQSVVSVVRLASGELALMLPILETTTLGEGLTVQAAFATPAPAVDIDTVIVRHASGDFELSVPALAGGAQRQVNAEAALIMPLLTAEAQAAASRFASGDMTLEEVELFARAFRGAIQPVIGLRATLTGTVKRVATVKALGKRGTLQ